MQQVRLGAPGGRGRGVRGLGMEVALECAEGLRSASISITCSSTSSNNSCSRMQHVRASATHALE
jgi:hypothetical protein